MGELVVLFISLAAIGALFVWVSRVIERGKRRFEVEGNANRPAPLTTTKEVKVIEKEKIVERQIVVIRCQFWGPSVVS